MAKLVEFSHIEEWQQKDGESFRDYMLRTDGLLSELMKKSDDLPEGEIFGAVISFPVGDGKAFYFVETSKPLKVSHIPFGDCYQVDPIMVEGLRPHHIKEKLSAAKSLKKLFGRQ